MATLGVPPLPPGIAGSASPAPQPPPMMQLAGMGAAGPQTPQTQGMTQISESAVRMGAEIDQALKLLAQALPMLAPWVEKTTMELRYQIGSVLSSGAVSTNPAPQDAQNFVDGSGRL